MSNGVLKLHERFFKLWAEVAMLVVDGKRYPFYVYTELQTALDLPDYKYDGRDNVVYRMLNEIYLKALTNENTLTSAIDALQRVIAGPTPVFAVLVLKHQERVEYVVGRSLDAILQDTQKESPTGNEYSRYYVIEESLVRALNFKHFEKSLEAARKGTKCYYIGSGPDPGVITP